MHSSSHEYSGARTACDTHSFHSPRENPPDNPFREFGGRGENDPGDPFSEFGGKKDAPSGGPTEGVSPDVENKDGKSGKNDKNDGGDSPFDGF